MAHPPLLSSGDFLWGVPRNISIQGKAKKGYRKGMEKVTTLFPWLLSR
jgi:hypothetical protein